MPLFSIVELCDAMTEIKIKCSQCLLNAQLVTIDDLYTSMRKDLRRLRAMVCKNMNLEQAVRVRDAWKQWTSHEVNPSTVSGFLYSDKLAFLDSKADHVLTPA